MSDVLLLDPIFNLRTVPPIPPGESLDDTSTIVTKVSIETARPIVVTQDPEKAGDQRRNYIYLPSTATIDIHGDEVTVCGKLSFPGREVVIFARVIAAEDDGANPATISVDAAPLADDKVAHPAAVPKGTSLTNKPDQPKVAVGKPEWLLRDHPEMNGYNGDPGNVGNAAGNVWLCCHKTSFCGTEHKLIITAKGGPGGDGQPGQAGADGGSGHHGKSAAGSLIYPEAGTKGGDGGTGGKGGKAGKGGNGGRIIFHCLTSQPAVSVHYGGGDPGARGEGGARGDRGQGGIGGQGGWVSRAAGGPGPPLMEYIEPAPNGPDGQYGEPGERGDEADPSQGGSSTITWGKVDSTDLVRLASVTQLQMLFERTRADYLVTETRDYSVRLMACAPPQGSVLPDLVNDGTNLVVVGRSRDGLHVRIFDATGQIVVDKQEAGMIADQRRFLISMADVLEAGDWATPEELHAMSSQGQRQRLTDQLSRISGLCNEPDPDKKGDACNAFKVNDYDLTGDGAVTAFLLQMGIRDEAGLKVDLEHYRNALMNALIPEVARNTGYDEASLRKLNNQDLVQVALDLEIFKPKPRNKFVLRGHAISSTPAVRPGDNHDNSARSPPGRGLGYNRSTELDAAP